MEKYEDEFELIVSHTTRPQREGESEGVDYFFVSEVDFEERQKREEFLEFTLYNGNLYGTCCEEVQKVLGEEKFPLLDLDLNGVLSAFNLLGKQNFFGVWIDAPEKKVLLERLSLR